MNGYFVAVRKAYKNALAKFFEEFVKIVATAMILNIFLPSTLDYMCLSLIAGDVISEFFSFWFTYIALIKDKNYSKTFRAQNVSYTSKILRISLPVAFTSYIKSGLSTLKQIIIPISLEKSGLGCSLALSNYGIVSGMAIPVIMFPSVFINCFASLLVPEFARYYVKKDSKRIKQMSTFILISTLLFSVFIWAIIFFFAKPISNTLYKQVDISQYVRILSFLIPCIYLDLVVDNILKGLDAQISVIFINIADCLITTFFIYWVVPILGFLGYILSIFVSEIFNVALSLLRLIVLINRKDRQ